MLEIWQLWAIAGILLWIMETFVPLFVTGIFGTACLILVPLALAHVPLTIQLFLFVLISAVLTLGIRPIVLKYFYHKGEDTKTNTEALVGKTGLVTEVIDTLAGTGSVKIGGETWRAAVTNNKSRVEIGQIVTVKYIEGAKVIVDFETETKKG
jgi:membrane protein implicated in regulation of membrane protease activity